MNLKRLAGFIFLAIITISSCQKNISKPSNNLDIYVAGYSRGAGNAGVTATYWKNGSPIYLTGVNVSSNALAIAVNNSYVYVAGSISTSVNLVATLWKNGVPLMLADSTSNSSASAITIAGDVVYVAGSIGLNPVYWKNGSAVTLPLNGASYAYLTGIAVVGNDVYTSGVVLTRQGYAAAYWKNNTGTLLTDPTKVSASATGIAVLGNDVYVVGTVAGFLGNVATCWKNGIAINLASGINSNANAIAINGINIYIAGQATNSPNVVDNTISAYHLMYWKNNINQVSSQNGDVSGLSTTGIAVSGEDVYISGTYNGQACYWMNGVVNTVATGQASGIVVVTP